MSQATYMYQVNYQSYEKDLCMMERRALFGKVQEEKVFFSSVFVRPSVSAFIKKRLEIIYSGKSLQAIIDQLSEDVFEAEAFKVEFTSFTFEEIHMSQRRSICEAIGLNIKGLPDFKQPKYVYGVTVYEGVWYFGLLSENDNKWKAHKDKPYTYSSSLGINLAKSLVNIASQGDVQRRLIDPCCGVGTVLLEAAFAGYKIVGSEINYKVAKNARNNLTHYGYQVEVFRQPIQEIEIDYDVSIIDLPYGNFSPVTQEEMKAIICSGLGIAPKMVLVSSVELSDVLHDEGIEIVDQCLVSKKATKSFERYVWLCQRLE